MLRRFKKHHRAFRVGYVLGRHLAKGKPDPREPKVIGGDPDVFEVMRRRWNRYTQSHYAAVLSFEEELSDTKAAQLAEEFFDVLLPGRHEGQFLTLAVRHRERGRQGRRRTGIHVFVFHLDLWRDRKVDVYWSARDQRRLEAWQEHVNLRDNLASPKEPVRSRSLHVRVWPESPDAAELVAGYGKILGRLPFSAAAEDAEEIASALTLKGALGVHLDRTRAGRLRTRFSAQAPDGREVRVSAIAAPEKRDDPLQKSSLRAVLGSRGFERTSGVFTTVTDLLVREIAYAAKRHESRHGASPERLDHTLSRVRGAQFHLPQPSVAVVRDETSMGLQPMLPPEIFGTPLRVEPPFQAKKRALGAVPRETLRYDCNNS